MANTQRGEVSIELCGKKYTLRPTFEAICELEDSAKVSVIEMISNFQNMKLASMNLRMISSVVWSGMWGHNKKDCPIQSEVGEMILKDGIWNVFMYGADDKKGVPSALSQFLLNAVMGGEDPKEADSSEKDEENPREVASKK